MEKAKKEMRIKLEDTRKIWSQRIREFEKMEREWKRQIEEAEGSAEWELGFLSGWEGRSERAEGGDRKILCIYLRRHRCGVADGEVHIGPSRCLVYKQILIIVTCLCNFIFRTSRETCYMRFLCCDVHYRVSRISYQTNVISHKTNPVILV